MSVAVGFIGRDRLYIRGEGNSEIVVSLNNARRIFGLLSLFILTESESLLRQVWR